MAIPDLDDVKSYLTGANGQLNASWTDELLSEALASETEDQARYCTVPEEYPTALGWALKRRVQILLTMLNQPVGMSAGDLDNSPVTLPGRDPVVRRLEAPYRRVVLL